MGKLPSLGNLGVVNKPQTTATTQTTAPTDQPKRETPFTRDQLIDAWVGLNKHFPREERLLAMLSAATPEILNPRLCRITVANPWQKQEFAKFGKQVMNIVREQLKNDYLMLQVDVETRTETARAYTAAEKYKLLAKQNPHLEELKNKMNLQLE